ncbi:cadherin-1 [Etheostoma spectabile]|uniref:cadherin-1 n=1 Tax=Etheostoma spectabile TaxID=54343 RepID=UPI0013AFA122|nr:cadherin-1-like [Etheostoma spectabile]
MGTAGLAVLGILIVVFQASALVANEEPTCVPGFESDMLIYKVSRKHLKKNTRLGKVGFTDCTDRTRFVFSSDNSHFMVQTDGILKVKRPTDIHGHREFIIHVWDSQGYKISVPVRVLHHLHHHESHHQNAEHNHQHPHTEVEYANNTESATGQQVPILQFPKSVDGLRRRKREWVIPDLTVVENDRGPYPLKVSQIRSNADKVKKIFYSITGPGADEPPVGLFTMDRNTGTLYLTQPLDREDKDKYMFQAHAVADGSGNAEAPMDIIVKVIDQNDNKPTFTQSTFLGEVAEASPKGFEVIKVVATDIDQPNTDNSDIRYSIMSQDPVLPSDFLFVINPVTGVIRVNAGGLDREKYPKYTLVVRAADTVGEGLIGEAKVILTVTDSNDNAPAFIQPSYLAAVDENKVNAQILTISVTDGDEPHSPAWNAKFRIVDGDPGGLFTVKTGSNKHEGIISTAKGLDFEKSNTHTLLIAVENEVPFAIPLPTATATVLVTVQDVNEAPVFDPLEKHVLIRVDFASFKALKTSLPADYSHLHTHSNITSPTAHTCQSSTIKPTIISIPRCCLQSAGFTTWFPSHGSLLLPASTPASSLPLFDSSVPRTSVPPQPRFPCTPQAPLLSYSSPQVPRHPTPALVSLFLFLASATPHLPFLNVQRAFQAT